MATKKRGFEIVSRFKDAGLQLPQRSTTNAAGYDFHAAETITIPSALKFFGTAVMSTGRQTLPVLANSYLIGQQNLSQETMAIVPVLVPTGIKAYMQPNEVLMLINRSSGPLKRFLVQTNGTGVIDADYYNNEANEGEIFEQFINLSDHDYVIHKGDRICQGIFMPYLKADDDNGGLGTRQGGLGSTGDK